MQFKVPQNIDMADRIVGPLTLIQFLYLLVGGIVIYVLFSVVSPVSTILFFALAFPIGFLTFALAFLKIQDQPFAKFILAFIAFLFRPKMRVWSKEGLDSEVVTEVHTVKKSDRVTPKPIKKSDLERLTQALDTGTPAVRGRTQAAATRVTPTPAPAVLPAVDSMRRRG